MTPALREQLAQRSRRLQEIAAQLRTEQLIEQGSARYARETEGRCGLRFELDASVHEQIYANAVFPAQGTRPLFSSLHAILGAGLAKAALWALEQGAEAGESVKLAADGRCLAAHWRDRSQAVSAPFEINRLRQRSSPGFRALLAVHEAGHGLVHALLFGRAPKEIKIHVASFDGGYNTYTSRKVWSRRNLLDAICTSLAGRAAELLVFGPEMTSSGAESDLRKATETAARMLRHQGHGARIGASMCPPTAKTTSALMSKPAKRGSKHCCRPSTRAPRG